MFSLLFQAVYAADFSINVDKGADYPFYATRTDYITVTINNPLSENLFTISVVGDHSEWINVESSILRIPGSGSGSIRIAVKPSRDAEPGIYKYFLKVSRVIPGEISGDYVEQDLLVNIVQITSAILKDVSLSCTSCIDNVIVSGEVLNVGSKPLDLSLIFKYADIQKTVNVGKLDSNEQRKFETSLDLRDMNPTNYDVDILLVDVNGNIQYTEKASFAIPIIENVIYDKKFSSTPFGSSIMVTATNFGNVISEIDLKSVSPNNWYSIISGPNPTGMMTGYYFWRTSLDPKQSISVSYSEIYWPTYVLIIAVVGALMFVYWQSSAFTFSKNVIGKTTFKSGKDISISLNLKSRRKSIDRVAIRDVVPPNFSIVSKFETVKPLIRKVADGVELIWKLGGLNPNEERVLHYTIRPNAEFSRKVSLPSALAKTAGDKGLTLKHSNKVSLYPEKEATKIVSVKVAQ
jgi:hypothetical protein